MAAPETSRVLADTGGLLVTDDGRRVVVIDRRTGALSTLAFVLGVTTLVVGGFGMVALLTALPSRMLGALFVGIVEDETLDYRLRPELAGDPRVAAAFMREAREVNALIEACLSNRTGSANRPGATIDSSEAIFSRAVLRPRSSIHSRAASSSSSVISSRR